MLPYCLDLNILVLKPLNGFLTYKKYSLVLSKVATIDLSTEDNKT